ncbi:MAG: 4-alpha-glucanotransferase [Deltaproteobacteria bacterium]|nr:4-alpha-glucanotransferase [Deltaproteobacteria bacterium]
MLAIHDISFPSDPGEDLGRGSPAARAASRLFAYAASLGFTGIQLGPQGQTSRDNPSPYDGAIFSRHLGLVPMGTWADLVDEAELSTWRLRSPGGPAQHGHAWDGARALRAVAYAELTAGAWPDLREELAAYRRDHAWCDRDGLYEALAVARGVEDHRAWPVAERDLWFPAQPALVAALAAEHEEAIDRYAFGQLLAHREHVRVRGVLLRHRLALYGDLQVGYADRDAWVFRSVFFDGYRMGAPPSRTNPEGQPWNYPVLDPQQLRGDAGALVAARFDSAFDRYDSMRIDHPHGLVCPWIYCADSANPLAAVQSGARVYDSPDLPDHPRLAAVAIARADQLDRSLPRYADAWVRDLDAAQVDRYAILFDMLVASARRHGRDPLDLSCEVLSTMPRPLGEMLRRTGLGRWRITQKANLDDPRDVYRAENAEPRDWVMLGNHDTAPVFALIKSWRPAKRDAWARHLSAVLHLAHPERLSEPGYLATAMLAELLASRAENVSIFFADLFGCEERFNVPGLVDAANWTLRLPHDFEALHAQRLAAGTALDLGLAVELALAAQEHGAERR